MQHLISPFTAELLYLYLVVTISLTRLLLVTSQLQNKMRALKSQGKLCQIMRFTLQLGWAGRR